MKQRLLTGVLAAALFLFLVIFGGLPFTVFVYVMGSIALFELLRMKKLRLFFFSGSDQPLVVMAVYDAGQVSFFRCENGSNDFRRIDSAQLYGAREKHLYV